VSVVGIGCNNFGWRLDEQGTRDVVDAAIDAGITLFDTADIYGNKGGSEELLGTVLKGRREQIVLATKFGHQQAPMGYDDGLGPMGGRAYIRYAVEQSLRRLQTDYIDLYQIHTPDPVTPIDETLSALHELVLEGKVRTIGSSQFAGWQVVQAAHVASENHLTPFISAQNQWSLLERDIEAELVPAAIEYGIGVLPFFPLASGLLTGKVRRGTEWPTNSRLEDREGSVSTAQIDVIEALAEWSEVNGHTLLETAIGVLAATQPVASVIAGATSPDQVRMNAAAAEWVPTKQQIAEVSTITGPPTD